ncbi:uncharacterized protein LOC124162886 [Ischnura elegans]|uniref:uncharacterized protein LOC124162886 n=1 Tax=Ischnura elegans TaxID=197161 RepID=UPI001ED8A670|nr:uncharacterized protein LOC124162886 [Ischnura elegans]
MVTSTICIGQGYSQMAEMSAVLDMPCMSNSTYQKTQQIISSAVHDVAWDLMKKASEQEAELAIQAGEIDKNGVPLITVVADGSWGRRSYKTNYNSLSGVACIVGYRTKKVLFIGVRNKYCSICAKAASSGRSNQPKEHLCFKNWASSSTAMESDIIVEGFKKSIEMHNLKYHRLIGDGDSSITKKLAINLPYGIDFPIQKIECVNPLLRNYYNRIRVIIKKTKNEFGRIPPLLRKRVGDRLMRLRTAVTSAIFFVPMKNHQNQ